MQIKLSGIPLLVSEPPPLTSDIMTDDFMSDTVCAIPHVLMVGKLVDILNSTRHNGFPVVASKICFCRVNIICHIIIPNIFAKTDLLFADEEWRAQVLRLAQRIHSSVSVKRHPSTQFISHSFARRKLLHETRPHPKVHVRVRWQRIVSGKLYAFQLLFSRWHSTRISTDYYNQLHILYIPSDGNVIYFLFIFIIEQQSIAHFILLTYFICVLFFFLLEIKHWRRWKKYCHWSAAVHGFSAIHC